MAVFLHDFSRTGVVLNAVRLANALAARGHRVTLLACSDRGLPEQRLDSRVRVEIPCRSWFRRLPRGISMLAALPALRRCMIQLRPGVLLSAGNHGHLPAMLASAGIPGLRRVLRISNDLDHPGDGVVLRMLRRVAHWYLVNQSDLLLLISPHLMRHPLLARAHAVGKVAVVPNGVPVDEVRSVAALGCEHPWIGQGVPVVVAMGRLTRQKNFPTLIRAFARACAERPMRLIIIGAGSKAACLCLEGLARQLGIQDRMRLEGEMINPFALLARCDVFVLPSLWEGASNALLEAMACDLPVVAARSAGNAQEVLRYGCHGLLVDPMDIEAMAQAIVIQTGEGVRMTGQRINDFNLGNTLARACAAITDEAVSRTVSGMSVERA